jgi:Leucine-rich repeat (LRR) protein
LEGKIPSYIAELKELTSLNLAKNAKLKNYESLKDLEKLNYLNIRHNDLKSVPDTVIEMKNLRGLEIAFNPLDTIPRELVTKKDLNRLMIDPCQIRAVPDNIPGNVDAEFHIVVKSDSLDCPAVKYRYVMIRREKTYDDHYLNLAEVEVYSGGTNIARGKTVTASSVYRKDYVPSRLTDGSRSSVAHTLNDAVEWFKIDLGESSFVDEVVIYNRRDCCKERAENIKIHLSVDGTTDLKVSDPISTEQAVKLKFTWKPQEGTSITAE